MSSVSKLWMFQEDPTTDIDRRFRRYLTYLWEATAGSMDTATPVIVRFGRRDCRSLLSADLYKGEAPGKENPYGA